MPKTSWSTRHARNEGEYRAVDLLTQPLETLQWAHGRESVGLLQRKNQRGCQVLPEITTCGRVLIENHKCYVVLHSRAAVGLLRGDLSASASLEVGVLKKFQSLRCRQCPARLQTRCTSARYW